MPRWTDDYSSLAAEVDIEALPPEARAIPLDIQAIAREYWQRKRVYFPSLAHPDTPDAIPSVTLQRITAEEMRSIIITHFQTISAFQRIESRLRPILQILNDGDVLGEDDEMFLMEAEMKLIPLYYSLMEHMIVEPQRFTFKECQQLYDTLTAAEQVKLSAILQLQMVQHASEATVAQRLQRDATDTIITKARGG